MKNKNRNNMIKITTPSGDRFVWQDEYNRAERNAMIYASIACAGLFVGVWMLVYYWLIGV